MSIVCIDLNDIEPGQTWLEDDGSERKIVSMQYAGGLPLIIWRRTTGDKSKRYRQPMLSFVEQVVRRKSNL